MRQANDVAKMLYELQWNNTQPLNFERISRILELYTVGGEWGEGR